jgi:hypothetical protein
MLKGTKLQGFRVPKISVNPCSSVAKFIDENSITLSVDHDFEATVNHPL